MVVTPNRAIEMNMVFVLAHTFYYALWFSKHNFFNIADKRLMTHLVLSRVVDNNFWYWQNLTWVYQFSTVQISFIIYIIPSWLMQNVYHTKYTNDKDTYDM